MRISGDKQAENFINIVPVENYCLPPVVDLEFGGNSEYRPDKYEFMMEIKKFLNIIQKHYKKKPVLYVTYEFYKKYINNDFNDYKIWIRDLFKKPDMINWLFWQYNCRGYVNGIKGFVDINIFNGNESDFYIYIKNYNLNYNNTADHMQNNFF